MTKRELAGLGAAGQRRHYPRGTEIFAQGAPGTSLLVIETGVVEVAMLTEDGRRVVVAHIGAHQIVGELALLDRGPRSAAVSAATDVTGAEVSAAAYRSFLKDHPDRLLALTELLCVRLRQANAALADRTARDGASRMALCLVRLAEVAGTARADGSVRLQLKMSQSELGDLVGLTRANVNRLLRRWTEAGLLGTEDGNLVLLEPERLAALGGGEHG